MNVMQCALFFSISVPATKTKKHTKFCLKTLKSQALREQRISFFLVWQIRRFSCQAGGRREVNQWTNVLIFHLSKHSRLHLLLQKREILKKTKDVLSMSCDLKEGDEQIALTLTDVIRCAYAPLQAMSRPTYVFGEYFEKNLYLYYF